MAIRTAGLTSDTLDALQDLKSFADRSGIAFSVRSALRTCDEQQAIFEQGRVMPGPIVTKAEGCESWHVLGRAVDINIPNGTTADYQKLGLFWEELGGHWGGNFGGFPDIGHFEWHPGLVIEEVCPVPSDCEASVALHMKQHTGRRIPLGGMFAIAGISAAAVVMWGDIKWR